MNVGCWPDGHDPAILISDAGNMRKISQEMLDALNNLVQMGLIEVVSIDEFGEPSYRIASQFTAEHAARTTKKKEPRTETPTPLSERNVDSANHACIDPDRTRKCRKK